MPEPTEPRPEPRDIAAEAWDFSDSHDDVIAGAVGHAILLAFNPPDEDCAYDDILVRAVARAAAFIEGQPCTCGDADDDPCDRCLALGRIADKEADRA